MKQYSSKFVFNLNPYCTIPTTISKNIYKKKEMRLRHNKNIPKYLTQYLH